MNPHAQRHNHRSLTGRDHGRQAGFTLIELLTVVAIIGLLVGMVVPTISAVLDSLTAARTLARIDNLANGAKMYKIEGTSNKYFPGQQYAKEIFESGSMLGGVSYKQAGSAFLARALFSKPDPNNTTKDLFPVGHYAVLDQDLLDPPDVATPATGRDTPRPYSILDCSSHPMAILYYISRANLVGKIEQYGMDDNKVYFIDDSSCATWDLNGTPTKMTIQRYVSPGTNAVIKMDGQFVITAAGKATSTGARQYFSATSLKNWRD